MVVDGIEIQIQSDASKACAEIDKLIGKLGAISANLMSVNTNGLNALSNGVVKLGASMKSFKSDASSKDFTNLSANLGKLSKINTSQIFALSNALVSIGNGTTKMSAQALSSAQGISELAKAINTFGHKTTGAAVANIPMITNAFTSMITQLSKAPQVSQSTIQLANAMALLAKQGSAVGVAGRALNNATSVNTKPVKQARVHLNNYTNSAYRATKANHSLAYSFGMFYANFFLLIRGIKALGKAITSTMDYIETYNYFNVINDKVGQEFSDGFAEMGYESAEAYADSFKQRLNALTGEMTGYSIGDNGSLNMTDSVGLGLDPNSIMNYQASIMSITNAIGLTGEVSLATARAMSMLSADMSSLKNVDLETVMTNLQSGLIGQSRALYKYGIDITNNTLQTYAFANGIEKSVSEMTQSEKMQLRLLAILDQSKVAWGDMANTVGGVANQYRIFKQQVSNLARTIGAIFLPVVQTVLPYINGFIIALQRLFTWVGNLLGVDWDNLMDGISSGYTDSGLDALADSAEDVTDGLGNASDAAKKLNKQLLGYHELNVLSTKDEESGGGGSGAASGGGIDLSGAINASMADYQAVWDKAYEQMENRAQEFADRISRIFEPIKKLFRDISIGDWFAVGGDISDIAIKIFNFLSSSLKKIDWNKIGRNIGELLSGINWTGILMSAGNFFETLVDSAIDLWKGSFDAAPIETLILSALALLKFIGAGNAIWTAIETSFSATLFGKSIGFAPTVAISAVTWVIGFNVGKSLGEALFPNDKIWYENFTFFGDVGFFKTITENFQSTLNGLVSMITDFRNNPIIATLASVLSGPFVTASVWIWKFNDDAKVGFETFINDGMSELGKLKENIDGFVESNILPLFSAETWKTYAQGILDGLSGKWDEIVAWWQNIALVGWWIENVMPWFTETRWSKLFDNIKRSLQTVWKTIANWWQNTALVGWWTENVMPWFEKDKWIDAMGGVVDAFKQVFKDAANVAIAIFNDMIGFINEKMHIEWDAIEIAGEEIVPGGSAQLFTIPTIPMFKSGGFPEDGLFMANHNELVGQFSNGKTAVANNEQIVGGIASGVSSANDKVVNALVAVGNAIVSAVQNGSRIEIDGQEVFNVVKEQSYEYSKQYGQPAFS